MIINTINIVLNYRFPLFFSGTPSFLTGRFCFKPLGINILFFERSPPISLFFLKTIQESIQGGKFEREILPERFSDFTISPRNLHFFPKTGEIHSIF